MADRDPKRLSAYLDLITKRGGGAERLLPGLDAAVSSAQPAAGFALEGLPVPGIPGLAAGAVRATVRGTMPTAAEAFGLEAIIYADLRPAADVVDGTFAFTHELWRHLSDDAATRTRIEAAIPAVGRVELPGNPRMPYGGTAFIVGDGVMMTNRHVAAIFTSGQGTKALSFVSGGRAAIDFKRERRRPPGRPFAVRRVVMVHPYWDMALLQVEGLGDLPPLALALEDARECAGREIFVVGYPAFDPRNPSDVQTSLFDGEYGVKRLQPGELHSGMQTGSFGKMVWAATHDCSTLGGNSGSAVVDVASGAVMGLHFGGAYQERNYCVPSIELSRDARVIDAGVRFAGTPSGGPNVWGGWWKTADADADERAAPSDEPKPALADAQPGPAQQAVAAVAAVSAGGIDAGGITIEIPLRITIVAGAARIVPAGPSPAETAAEAHVESLAVPLHDTDYASRTGYDPLFLGLPPGAGAAVPMPRAKDQAVLAVSRDSTTVLDYQNFSICMHAARRLALVCASNVTSEAALRRPEAGRNYTRRGLTGLGPNDQEKWFADPRLDERFQLPDVFFTQDRQAFDKGHLVRRDDVAWGTSYDALRRANGDSFHVTNCSPQVAGFNRSNKGVDNWGDLENQVLADAETERLCVFAGPVLDPADEVFVGVAGKGVALRAKIPTRFWKVIVARAEGGIAAYGFVLEQDLSDVQFEFVVPPEFLPSMRALDDIGLMAGVVFDPVVLAADQFGTAAAGALNVRAGLRPHLAKG